MGLEFHTKITLEVFPNKVDALLDTPEGPAGRLVKHAAEITLIGAKRRIGDRYSGHHGIRIKDTGRVESIGGSAYAVIFDHPVAFLHHEGTQAKNYPIGAKGKRLVNRRDPARTKGGPFYAHGVVIHPGSSGNPFIREAAAEAGLTPSGQLMRGQRPSELFRLPKSI